jgi:hypothetical protein
MEKTKEIICDNCNNTPTSQYNKGVWCWGVTYIPKHIPKPQHKRYRKSIIKKAIDENYCDMYQSNEEN